MLNILHSRHSISYLLNLTGSGSQGLNLARVNILVPAAAKVKIRPRLVRFISIHAWLWTFSGESQKRERSEKGICLY
jgi:hypothetical protein